MISTLAVLVLSATSMKVSAPPWKLTGIEASEGSIYQSRFLTLLGEKTGLEIITAEDMEAVLGIERQRQLLGCDDGSSNCTAELAAALGADALLTGSVAKVGASYVITLRGVNTVSGTPFATATTRVQSQDAVLQFIESEAKEFAARMTEAFNLYVESRRRPAANVQYQYKKWPWAFIGSGAGIALLGGGGFLLSRTYLAQIREATFSTVEEDQTRASTGQWLQDGGVVAMIAGGVTAAAGITLLFLTREGAPSLAVIPIPSGGVVVMGGAW